MVVVFKVVTCDGSVTIVMVKLGPTVDIVVVVVVEEVVTMMVVTGCCSDHVMVEVKVRTG